MGTSYNQDRQFIDTVISRDLLSDAIDWIAKNIAPEEVYSQESLASWATDNGFIAITDV